MSTEEEMEEEAAEMRLGQVICSIGIWSLALILCIGVLIHWL